MIKLILYESVQNIILHILFNIEFLYIKIRGVKRNV